MFHCPSSKGCHLNVFAAINTNSTHTFAQRSRLLQSQLLMNRSLVEIYLAGRVTQDWLWPDHVPALSLVNWGLAPNEGQICATNFSPDLEIVYEKRGPHHICHGRDLLVRFLRWSIRRPCGRLIDAAEIWSGWDWGLCKNIVLLFLQRIYFWWRAPVNLALDWFMPSNIYSSIKLETWAEMESQKQKSWNWLSLKI